MQTSWRRSLAFGAVLLVGCSGTPQEPATVTVSEVISGVPDTPPSLVGVVVQVTPDGRVLLEHRPLRVEECHRQALGRITSETLIRRQNGTAASATDLRAGQQVRAWFGAHEMRSCPVQVSVVSLVIE